jgi:hypothetical protein
MSHRWLPLASLLLAACHSAGPYGYSRSYEPLSSEEAAAAGARELDPVMAQRVPQEWKRTRVSVFGVVLERADAAGGVADLTLSMRSLAERNLCDAAEEASCRVTVSPHEHARVHAIAKLRPSDVSGARGLQAGSLVRVIGRLAAGTAQTDGASVLEVEYYRHWPRGEYVTTLDSDHMRR